MFFVTSGLLLMTPYFQPIPEPDKLTKIIVEALEITGQRGIINKGWGGLGNLEESKDFVYVLDNIPHDWLFLQCKAVVRLVLSRMFICQNQEWWFNMKQSLRR